jgi:hypothetical protein
MGSKYFIIFVLAHVATAATVPKPLRCKSAVMHDGGGGGWGGVGNGQKSPELICAFRGWQ